MLNVVELSAQFVLGRRKNFGPDFRFNIWFLYRDWSFLNSFLVIIRLREVHLLLLLPVL